MIVCAACMSAVLVVQAAVSLALGSGWVEQVRQIVLSLTFTANSGSTSCSALATAASC